MPNIQLNYLYRDYANYKNHGEVVFNNPENLSLESVEASLHANLIDGEYFYASRWAVPDMHFEKYDDQNDHPYHEFGSVQITEEPGKENIALLLERVTVAGREY